MPLRLESIVLLRLKSSVIMLPGLDREIVVLILKLYLDKTSSSVYLSVNE